MESGDDRDTLVSEINDNGHYARFPFPTKPDTWARSQNPFDRSEGESRWLAEPASGGGVRCLVESLPANANAGFDVHVGPLGGLDDVTIESEVVRTQRDSGALLAVAVYLDADDNGEFFEWKDADDATESWVGFGGDSEGLTALPTGGTVTVDDSTEFPLFHVAEEGAAATLGELKAGDVNGADGTTIDGETNAAIYVGALSAGEERGSHRQVGGRAYLGYVGDAHAGLHTDRLRHRITSYRNDRGSTISGLVTGRNVANSVPVSDDESAD